MDDSPDFLLEKCDPSSFSIPYQNMKWMTVGKPAPKTPTPPDTAISEIEIFHHFEGLAIWKRCAQRGK